MDHSYSTADPEWIGVDGQTITIVPATFVADPSATTVQQSAEVSPAGLLASHTPPTPVLAALGMSIGFVVLFMVVMAAMRR